MKRTPLAIPIILIIAAAAILLAPIAPPKTSGGPAQSIIGSILPPNPQQSPVHLDADYLPGPPSSPGGPPLLPEKVVRTNRSESDVQSDKPTYQVSFPSGTFTPTPGIDPQLQATLDTTPLDRIHAIAQFAHVLSREDINKLEAKGLYRVSFFNSPGDLGDTWLVVVSVRNASLIGDDPLILWLGPIAANDKSRLGELRIGSDGRTFIAGRFFLDTPDDEMNRVLKRYEALIEEVSVRYGFRLYIRYADIPSFLREEYVMYIEPATNRTNLNVDSRNSSGVSYFQDTVAYLNGSGVNIGVWEFGNGGNAYIEDTHQDLQGRIFHVDNTTYPPTYAIHATHVAGTLAGNGSRSEGQGFPPLHMRGIAPHARLFSYNSITFFEEHQAAILTHGINLSQNSWGDGVNPTTGCDKYGDYTSDAEHVDDIVRGVWGKPISVIFAVGNERDDGDCPANTEHAGYRTTDPPATTKNGIAVGATNTNDSMTNFSSWGPTDDGRIKPDLVAPGCKGSLKPSIVSGEGTFNSAEYVISPITGNQYDGGCGTSMAAPIVSGIIALLTEEYRMITPYNDYLLPSTFKALLVHTADDFNYTGPDYSTGWGRVNATGALEMLKTKEYVESVITSNNETDEYPLLSPPGESETKVTLAWDDPAGKRFPVKNLVNDLDLLLISPNGSEHRPWVLNNASPAIAATNGIDGTNNVEQVVVSNPTPGMWRVRVNGSIANGSGQNYSLIGPFSPSINNLTMLNGTANRSEAQRIFKFSLLNNNLTTQNLSWGLEIGNGTWVNSTGNLTLQPTKGATVFLERNYTAHGTYDVTAFASNSQWWNDSQKLTFTYGWLSIHNFSVISSNGTERTFRFKIKNLNATDNITGLNWTIDFGDGSRAVANATRIIANSTEHFFYVWHNYTIGNWTVHMNATAGSISGFTRPLQITVT